MAELKTQPSDASVTAFIESVDDAQKRSDCREILAMMERVTDRPPRMWGTGIVGFGSYHYRYKSGREGDWFVTGFAPRQRDITLYIMPGFAGCDELLGALGKHKTGKSCLYFKKLEDLDRAVLKKLIASSVAKIARMYDCE